jgi:hypothetical protein
MATVVLGTFAGLYGFYGLLGQPGGVLRQLLVAIPRAALYGAINYVYDSAIHLVFSNLLREIFAIPTSVLPSAYPYLIVGATFGFLQSFLLPYDVRASGAEWWAFFAKTRADFAETRAKLAETTAERAKAWADRARAIVGLAETDVQRAETDVQRYKARADRAKARADRAKARADRAGDSSLISDPPSDQRVRGRWLGYVLFFPTSMLYLVLAVQILLVTLHLIPGFRPSIQVVLIIAVCVFAAHRLAHSFWTGKQELSLWDKAFVYLWLFIGTAPWVVNTVYIVLQAGWLPSVVAFALLSLAGVVIRFLQYWADHLKRNTLQVISLVLFLLAAGLQLYQALAS